MALSREDVLALHSEHRSTGISLAELGRRLGLSRERMRQLFEQYGLEPLSREEKRTLTRSHTHQEALRHQETIATLYRQHGTVAGVRRALRDMSIDLPQWAISGLVNSIPNRESYKRRGTRETYTREELIQHVRIAARESKLSSEGEPSKEEEPLSHNGYMAIASKLHLAAYLTQVRHFGSFPAACEAAGVRYNAPLGRRASSIDIDRAVDAVEQCFREHGGRTRYEVYSAWAAEQGNGIPSGSAIRTVGRWNDIASLALDRLASSLG